ncbi:aldose epimerase family protein [Sphingobacterium deserti]|uniref:Aldose 1-epimerase n=1 Tax=Sphingobacterium deserti TaxID=1229276 RepID=A0A0B8T0M3_9SPHI|nr:aldose epimerase family protein [Sphingobacterium deserti]KGE14182.1 aldose 1-epimerase [Sphingobacterium deserti]
MMKKTFLLVGLATALSWTACQNQANKTTDTELSDSSFAGSIDGQEMTLFTLKNEKGAKATFTNFGARIVSLWVPDKEGNLTDVVLGFNKAGDYNNPEEPYYGTIVGPFGNRIAKGKFTLDGEEYTLPTNNGGNTLHGGFKGVHFAAWEGKQDGDNKVTFSYTLPDKNEGFPGNISMTVTYKLTDDNALEIDYTATTDKKTVVNLTNHAYFNLNGEGSGTILDHSLQIYGDQYTPVDSTLIPTGELATVKGTPFDFSQAKTIGKDIEQQDEQLRYGGGYDHNFILRGDKVDNLNHAATLIGDKSGIKMDIYTEEPGLQFYSGNFMAEKVTLKNGKKDAFRTGLCLETQHFPDAPNQANFPSTVLEPGQTYTTKSIYKFSL